MPTTTIGYESIHTGSQIDEAVRAVLGNGGDSSMNERIQTLQGEIEEMNENVIGQLDNLETVDKTDIVSAINEVRADANDIALVGAAGVDFSIKDCDNNAIVEFYDGHIRTKNFDSANIPMPDIPPVIVEHPVEVTNSVSDFSVTDENENSIVEFSGGHVRTKKFNSRDYGFDAVGLPTLLDNPLARINYHAGMASIFSRIFCIGDSLTAGVMAIGDSSSTAVFETLPQYSWPEKLNGLLGNYSGHQRSWSIQNRVMTFARGGLTLAEFFDVFYTGFEEEFMMSTPKADCVIIALGVNDAGLFMKDADVYPGYKYPCVTAYPNRTSYGSLNITEDEVRTDVEYYDTSSNDAFSFVGQYYKLIRSIKAIRPETHVFCVTSPKNGRDEHLPPEWNEATRHIVKIMREKYGNTVWCIDIAKYSPWTDEHQTHFNYNGHLSAYGYTFVAYQMATYLDWIVRKNIDDFRNLYAI